MKIIYSSSLESLSYQCHRKLASEILKKIRKKMRLCWNRLVMENVGLMELRKRKNEYVFIRGSLGEVFEEVDKALFG